MATTKTYATLTNVVEDDYGIQSYSDEAVFMEDLTSVYSSVEEQICLLPQLSISRMDPLSQVFSLRWTQHQSNMFTVFEKLLQSEAFSDVTLACDGGSLKCHKIVLAASSDYFQKLFMDSNSDHPIVFLKDVKASQVRAILDYVYKGEVSVAQDELPALLKVAEMLKIKGMIEENAKNGGEHKDGTMIHPPRCSSPSAPPNSTVPPNGDSIISSPSALSMPNPSKTPTSIHPPHGAIPPNFRPFLTPPGGNSTPPFPMWPLPGLFPGAHNIFGRHDDRKELSPGPRDRSKMSSGSSSDKEIPLPPLIPRENCDDRDGKHGFEKDSEYNNEKSPRSGNFGNGEGKLDNIAGYVPAQRLEWKRYKQYTRNDIMQAIEEVRKGKSALQVSKKFNIPSRTLYDKVKKMGITTGRQQQRKSMNNSNFNYSAAFPGLNMMSPMSHLPENIPQLPENPYKSLMERMKAEREDEDMREGKDIDMDKPPSTVPKDLGPMPFSILPPHMLNMMERIKAEDKERAIREEDSIRSDERENSPINLSSERDPEKRMSEGSFPHSPSPGSTDLTTSPSNCQNSPPGGSGSDYNGGGRDRYSGDRSPDSGEPSGDRQQIDIRAQFLADLRRLGDSRNINVTSPDLTTNRASQDSLPPRKRKVSHDNDSPGAGAKINLQDHPGPAINGLCESDSAVVN